MAQIRPGQVIRIAESDYAYGLGALTIRVKTIESYSDPQWVRLRGTEIHWTGAEGVPREVLVRSDATIAAVPADRLDASSGERGC